MKKLLLCLSLCAGSFLFSQKYEINVGYGTPSFYGITNEVLESFSILIDNNKNLESQGVLNASVMMYSSDSKWRYGVDASLESFSASNGYDSKFVSIMPKVDYFWSADTAKLRLYSGVSIGLSMKSMSQNILGQEAKIKENYFGYNITPIGMRYGGDLGVFVETNFGNKGLLQGGVSYIF